MSYSIVLLVVIISASLAIFEHRKMRKEFVELYSRSRNIEMLTQEILGESDKEPHLDESLLAIEYSRAIRASLEERNPYSARICDYPELNRDKSSFRNNQTISKDLSEFDRALGIA